MASTTPTRSIRRLFGLGRDRRTDQPQPDTRPAFGFPAIAGVREPLRARLVDAIITELQREEIDAGTALLMLDVIGLTGDRDLLSHAVAARYMRDGLLDGTIDPKAVDPDIRVRHADEVLADTYDLEYQQTLVSLATVRLLPTAVAS